MSEKLGRRMGKAAFVVMAGILASRMLGFIREFIIARTMGADSETDIYYAAFTIPDFLNYLLAGGALSITFIPVFSRFLAEGREEEGYRLCSTVLNVMSIAMVALIILGEIFADILAPLIARGFEPWQKERLTYFVRIILPAQYCFYTGGILAAVQYSREKFLVPVLAPIIYNFGIIAGGLLLAPWMKMAGFCYGVLAGAIAGPLLLQIWGAKRSGFKYYAVIDLKNQAFREFVILTIPIMLGFSLVLVDEWIIKFFASYLVTASISWLNFARILMKMPVAVVGNAAGLATFPFLSRLAAEGRWNDWRHSLHISLKGIILLIVPLASWMFIMAEDLTVAIFLSSHFTLEDCNKTASILRFFIPGVFAWGVHAMIARGFYSLKNTWIPALTGSVITLIGVPLYWVMMKLGEGKGMPQEGLALASSISIFIYLIVLSRILAIKTGGSILGKALSNSRYIVLPTLISTAAVFLVVKSISGFALQEVIGNGLGSLLILVAGGIGGAVVFIMTTRIFAREQFNWLSGKIFRKKD